MADGFSANSAELRPFLARSDATTYALVENHLSVIVRTSSLCLNAGVNCHFVRIKLIKVVEEYLQQNCIPEIKMVAK